MFGVVKTEGVTDDGHKYVLLMNVPVFGCRGFVHIHEEMHKLKVLNDIIMPLLMCWCVAIMLVTVLHIIVSFTPAMFFSGVILSWSVIFLTTFLAESYWAYLLPLWLIFPNDNIIVLGKRVCNCSIASGYVLLHEEVHLDLCNKDNKWYSNEYLVHYEACKKLEGSEKNVTKYIKMLHKSSKHCPTACKARINNTTGMMNILKGEGEYTVKYQETGNKWYGDRY